MAFFSSYTATIFKLTSQYTSDRQRFGGFGLEIWNMGGDMRRQLYLLFQIKFGNSIWYKQVAYLQYEYYADNH
jgi:hypothetical protein